MTCARPGRSMKPSVGTVGRWPCGLGLWPTKVSRDELVLAERTRPRTPRPPRTSSWPPSCCSRAGRSRILRRRWRSRTTWSVSSRCGRAHQVGHASGVRAGEARRCAPMPTGAPGSGRSWASIPAPPTQALHAQVLAQAESLVAPARPEHRRITTAIPVPASETIGREEDLERLRRWREAGHRLLTLVGPGGWARVGCCTNLAVRSVGSWSTSTCPDSRKPPRRRSPRPSASSTASERPGRTRSPP